MADSTPFKAELARIARQENEALGALCRGDQELEQRIEFYCSTVAISATLCVKAHYSAVFISWCMRSAGASESEFPAAAGHWQYARRALQNAKQGQGLFRARVIESYAPQLGDVIHVNRDDGKVDYDRLRNGPYPYAAESGIVVGTREGEALIVMGNQPPGGTVGSEKLALDRSGLLVQRTTDPIICVIEVLK
jgi:hypothetical protein